MAPDDRTGVIASDPRLVRRAVGAAAIGNATEWFDFGVYSYLAATIGKVFYPAASEGVQLIASFTTFAAAFLVRPLGGLFFGPLGDRIGRQRVLALTMVLMAAGTLCIGLLPPYAAIGVAAPVLLLVARLVQGFSTGGEYGGATTFVAEYAPDRRRGFLCSWLEFGTICGYVAGALLVTALTAALSPAEMLSWGWRVPFLVAGPLGAVGLYLRLRLEDTPAFRTERHSFRRGAGEVRTLRAQFRATVLAQWRPLLLCVGLVLVFNVDNYLLTAYLPTYLSSVLGYDEAHGLLVVLVAMAAMLPVIGAVGRLSDRIGRRPVLISGCVASVVLALPAFWLLQRGSVAGVLLGSLALAAALVHFSGAAPATLPALFPTPVRYGALAIGFNVSVSLFGGTTPLVAEALVQATGNRYLPALQMMAAGVIGLVAVLGIRESAGRPLPGSLPAVAARPGDGRPGSGPEEPPPDGAGRPRHPC
ncbi:MFS transporter [Marinitenerispora sediminis]|uniref:MFS transporter n=1 Tax=Marinitenerispora sediminis TaxID=1931232 RepID=UPI001F426480|nr:MFS transporter [Marinitenerispora sediminis]